jgi:hypothetical protein
MALPGELFREWNDDHLVSPVLFKCSHFLCVGKERIALFTAFAEEHLGPRRKGHCNRFEAAAAVECSGLTQKLLVATVTAIKIAYYHDRLQTIPPISRNPSLRPTNA